jgi:hypothetical protein
MAAVGCPLAGASPLAAATLSTDSLVRRAYAAPFASGSSACGRFPFLPA